MVMRIGTPIPSFEGATDWINGTAAVADNAVKGRPTLVHFWSVSCSVCKDNLPRLARLRDQHQDNGLRIVAVHMPRYPEDTHLEAVREAVSQYNMTEICAVDNSHALRDAFSNDQGYVPAYYMFDAAGKLRGFAAGENGLNIITPAMRRVLEATQQVVG